MNKAEILRPQGINPKTFKVDVSLSSLGQQIGNGMSINAIERILAAALEAANVVRGGHSQF